MSLLAYDFTLVGLAAVISALGSLLSAVAAYRLAMRKDEKPDKEREDGDAPD